MENYKTIKVESKYKDDTNTLRIDPRRLIPLYSDSAIQIDTNTYVETRTIGVLKHHALYLPEGFDWILGKDPLGMVCLVPLRKDLEDIEEKRSEQLEKIIFALADSNIDRSVCDDIIEKLKQHERLQAAVTKHLEGHGRWN